MEAGATALTGGRSILERSPVARLPDRVLKWGLTALAAAILALLAYFLIRLIGESRNALSHFGLSFVFGNNWDAAHGIFHAFPMVFGTLVTSAIAMVIGVPVAVAAALYINELCPRRVRGPLSLIVDLLAAVPSVVYGLWGVFVLIPKLLPVEKWFASTFSFIPWIGGGVVTGPNYFIAGLIMAIMILPIVCAISREVIATVPAEDKEAALALGATRWEMIRISVLPYSRPGIVGGAMLGLGRALGETIAVVLVIGAAPVVGSHLFNQGYTLAAVIANEFGEAASTPVYSSSLFACGLVLFVLTLVVNIIARGFVVRGARDKRGRGAMGMTPVENPDQL
ncbi:MAG: phosphate ABC transporter permease subunit PstC [Solirubrobacteraceae bacterium]